MKTLKSATLQSITATAIVMGAAIPFAANAQSVTPEVATAARQACISSAESKGFQVAEVVSIEPKSGAADAANVVLSLTKAGQPYKLTCGYSKAAGAVFSDHSATTTTTPAPTTTTTTTAPAPAPTATVNPVPPASLAPLWWLLLPIIGLPLLIWWARGRGSAAVTHDRETYAAGRTEVIVRNHGNDVNVYSGPGTDYRVTGTLRDGQTVWLSGQYNNNWAELENGGWIPTQNIDTAAVRYAR